MSEMQKITVRVGQYDGSQKEIAFIGELLKTQQEFDAPNDKSRGTEYSLYRVPKGAYRIYEKRWANGQGDRRKNYARLSRVYTEAELLEKFPILANRAGIFETEDIDTDSELDEDEKTVLLAADTKGTRLLPYTLANVEELIELAHFLLDQEDTPEEIRAEFESALEQIESTKAS